MCVQCQIRDSVAVGRRLEALDKEKKQRSGRNSSWKVKSSQKKLGHWARDTTKSCDVPLEAEQRGISLG